MLRTMIGIMTCALLALGVCSAQSKSIVGSWQGTLSVPSGDLRIVLNIRNGADGALSVSVDSLDQGASGIPASSATFKDGSLVVGFSDLAGEYRAKLSEDGSTLSGTWSQGGASLPLTLKRVAKPDQVKRPQEPRKPYPYNEEEVSYPNKAAGISLAGTLTIPKAKGVYPAVILISGSGAQDRNEEVAGHEIFMVLADYLTRRGIAVLRVDDRGTGKSTGDFEKATSADFAGDVLAGIQYLKSRKDIDGKRIGLIGHSEGGIVAPMVASQSKDVAFIVLMAGPGIPGEQILYMQAALIARATGASEAAIEKERKLQESIFAVIKQESDPAKMETRVREILDRSGDLAQMPEEARKAFIDAQIKMVTSPWFRFFLTYDPAPALMKVTVPVLAINGALDLQVPPAENLAAVKKALVAGGNKAVTTCELPKLNHLFQTSTTGSPAEYSKIEETMSPSALKVVGDWVVKVTGVTKGK